MIRVLVVEDEPPIARAIVRLIEQHPAGYAVVGVEINGRDALDRLAREPVDAVFTDIRMPVMDGLELLMHLHGSGIPVNIISGYRDFEYAQAAIRYQAFDYILKPVSREKLDKLLDRLATVCEIKRREKKREMVQRSLGGAAHGAQKAECVVMLICSGQFPVITGSALVPGRAFWEKCILEDEISPLLQKGESCLVFDGRVASEKAVILECPALRGEEIARCVFERLAQLGGPPVTLIGVPKSVDISMVGVTINELRAEMYGRIKLLVPQLLWGENPDTPAAWTFPEAAIVEAVFSQNPAKLKDAVREAVARAAETGVTQTEFLRLFDRLISDGRLGRVSPGFASLKPELEIAVSCAADQDGLVDEITYILRSQLGAADERSKKDQSIIADEIEQFLLQNYTKAVSNEMLAARFGFVPSYISKIFRKHKGLGPSEYITRRRILAAKEHMRKNPDMLIRDIAEMVGYNDQYYFSKQFKKETGVWPTQFQKTGSAPR